jgi:hypothetical protein
MGTQNMINSTMPQQPVLAMPPGSKGPMDAGLKMQQQQTAGQMALIGKSGGSKRRKRCFKGGATTLPVVRVPPVVQVPPVQAGAANQDATAASFKSLTALSQQQAGQAVFDSAKTPSQTAALQAQQQALYKSGGSKSKSKKRGKNVKRGKRGGSVKWGCYSGGLKKSRKSRRTKRHRH